MFEDRPALPLTGADRVSDFFSSRSDASATNSIPDAVLMAGNWFWLEGDSPS